MLLAPRLPVPAAQDWPQWRGPTLDGSSGAATLPLEWSENRNVRWKVGLPCWAGSSPVIWGDRIFLTTPSAGRQDDEAAVGRRMRRARVEGGPGGRTILLWCLAKSDGRLLWQREIDDANKLYGKQNMASPSPVTDGRGVWTLTGTGKIAAFDMDGAARWTFDLQKGFGSFGLFWGYASSPLLYKDLLVVQVLHGSTTKDPSYLVAFDSNTGRVKWRTERLTDAERECPDAYTTPTIARADGRDELIVSGADYVTGHDPRTGRERWRVGGLNPERAGNFRICGSPLPIGDLVVATSREQPVLAVRCGADVPPKKRLAWQYTGRKAPDVPSAAGDGERIYLLHDDGFLTCLDAKTGQPLWGPERIERGTYSASPLVAAGRVYCTSEDATTTVVEAGPRFKVLATNRLDGGYTLSSLAVSGRALYLRTGKYLYCIAEK